MSVLGDLIIGPHKTATFHHAATQRDHVIILIGYFQRDFLIYTTQKVDDAFNQLSLFPLIQKIKYPRFLMKDSDSPFFSNLLCCNIFMHFI